MTGAGVADLLEREGFDFFAGVPCSLIDDLIAALEHHPRLPWVPAVREDVAVGLAGGAWLAGRRPAVLMQNSGLGTSFNALASLSLMYGLPSLLLVTWRGYQGKDAPEHILMGEVSPRLLNLLGIAHRVIGPDALSADITWARREMDARMQPVALLLPPGVLAPVEDRPRMAHTPSSQVAADRVRARALRAQPILGEAPEGAVEAPSGVISRMAAIAAVVKTLGTELVIHANGYPSREAFAVADRAQNFYMLGSMGLAAPIGLGLALSRPERRTVVFDGDGNLLMSLGVLANVADLAPPNFVHVVFDNEVYGSTGNQRSVSGRVRLDRLAAAAGYATVAAVTEADAVTAEVRRMFASAGPHFLLVKVTAEEAEVPRIPLTPAALRDRFRASVRQP